MWHVERLMKAEIKTPHSWIRFARIAQAQVCFASTILGSSPCCVTSWAQLRTSSCPAQWMVPALLDHKYRHYHNLLYQSQSSEDQFAIVLLWDVHLRSWHAHVAVTLFAGCASSVVLWTWAVSFIWIFVGVVYVLCILPIKQRSYHDLWMSSFHACCPWKWFDAFFVWSSARDDVLQHQASCGFEVMPAAGHQIWSCGV